MMIPLRIRKAEVAMKDGRLDEAYQEAIRDDVRNHRKGQRLVGLLTKAYALRGKEHLKSGNAKAALADADRAARLGGNQPQILGLREEARVELLADQTNQHARNQKLAAARRCLATGDYSLGAKLCDDVSPGHTVAGLMQDAEINRRIVETSLERGRKAIKSSQWELVLDAIDEAKRLQPSHPDLHDLLQQVTASVTKQIRTAFAKGRLDQAELLLNRIQQHASKSLEVQELARVLSHAKEASTATRNAALDRTIENLKTLKHIVPEARWLDPAIKDAESAKRHLENLRTGPLGSLLAPSSSSPAKTMPGRASQLSREASPVVPFIASAVIPTNFYIHLDGAGSFLVLRGSQATIGTQTPSRQVDVALQGQMGLPKLTVERLEDDYFLSSSEPVEVNRKQTTSKLLASHDQIRLGRRGSMHFAQPNAATTTATLDFAGVRMAHGNAKRVILMEDALVLGPQPSAHIQSLALERPMVIHFRDGEMRIRPLSRTAEGTGDVLSLDQPYDVDGLSLVVTTP